MGAVWRARDDRLDRDVAVKVVRLPPGLTQTERAELFERTLREARAAGRLCHPSIVTVHDVFEEGGTPCIVMELVQARSLQDVIEQDGRVPPVTVAEIGGQILAALRVAHASGILHRDVKPANVLLAAGPAGESADTTRVVITDFGIAATEGETALTRTGMVLGSPSFIAPERVRGQTAGPASDLWALGATMFAAVEGRPPYDHPDALETLMAVANDAPATPRNAGPLTPVLTGLLTKDPARRMSAEQAADELAQVASLAQAASISQAARLGPAAGEDQVTQGAVASPVPPAWEALAGAGPGAPASQVAEPASPEAAPACGRTARRSMSPLFAGLVVLAVVAAAGTTSFFLLRPAGGSPEHAAPPPPASSSAFPAGFQAGTGPGAVTLAVPAGWSRRALSTTAVRWTEPATGAFVQVDAGRWGTRSPVEHLRRFQRESARRKNVHDLRVLRRTGRFSARGWSAADLLFTWAAGSRRIRGQDRAFIANGHQYALLIGAPAVRWSRYGMFMDKVFGAFEPRP